MMRSNEAFKRRHVDAAATRRFAALLLLLAALTAAPAGELLITCGEVDEPFLLAANYFEPDQLVIQDLGIPAGGLDEGKAETDDVSAVVMQQPNSYILVRGAERPTALGIGIETDRPARLKIEVSVVARSLYAKTDSLQVFWNDRFLGEADGSGTHCRLSEEQEVRTVSFETAGEVAAGTGVLWVRPAGRHIAVLDALRVTGNTTMKPLSKEKTRPLFERYGPYETRRLRGEGKVLLCDFYQGSMGAFQYSICGALQANVDVRPSPPAWLSPAEWGKYKLVIIRTRHILTPAENRMIAEYVRNGGAVMITPDSFAWMTQGKVGRQSMLWCPGLLGTYTKFPPGHFDFQVASVPNPLPGMEPVSSRTYRRAGGGLSFFVMPAPDMPAEAWITLTHSSLPGVQHAALVVVRYGKGIVIGTAYPSDPVPLQLLRDIVVAVVSRRQGGSDDPL